MEQWSFTGGRDNSFAISVFFKSLAVSIDIPLIHSVASELDAIADPHPKVLNLASTIFPSSSTSIWRRMTSPHAGAPPILYQPFLTFYREFQHFLGFRNDQ